MKKGLFFSYVLVALISIQTFGMGNPPQATVPVIPQPTSPTPSLSGPAAFEPNTIADIAEKVGPAVVNIDVTKMRKTHVFNPFQDFDQFFGFQLDPEFRQFYEDKIVPVKGAGSGFIIDSKGHIVTNEHVVGGADKIKVTLKDGRKLDAKLIGADKTLDLAVIKIEAGDLPVVKLGDSSKLRPGEWAIAIGNPYEFSNTVTVGIISGTGRALADIGKSDLIQTDAPINPGNSGGPLINLNGEVIGINVAIAAQAQGIGFAIPINAAKDVLDPLINKGRVERAWMGIYMRDVDDKVAKYLDLPVAEGIMVSDVMKDSPAEKAGLKKGDIIKKMDGTKVTTSQQLSDTVKKMRLGSRVNLEVWREDKNVKITVKLGSAP